MYGTTKYADYTSNSQFINKSSAQKTQYPTINGIPIQPINEIIPSSHQGGAIFIGDIDAAKDTKLLHSLTIKAVLTVASNSGLLYSKRQQINHLVIPAQDQQYYDLAQHFDQTFRFIQSNRYKTNVLVHCLAGVSRSTTIVIAYLMRKHGWATNIAYTTVKNKRRLTCPNLGFCKQLKFFQKQILGQQKPSTERSTKPQTSYSTYQQTPFKNQYQQYKPQDNKCNYYINQYQQYSQPFYQLQTVQHQAPNFKPNYQPYYKGKQQLKKNLKPQYNNYYVQSPNYSTQKYLNSRMVQQHNLKQLQAFQRKDTGIYSSRKVQYQPYSYTYSYNPQEIYNYQTKYYYSYPDDSYYQQYLQQNDGKYNQYKQTFLVRQSSRDQFTQPQYSSRKPIRPKTIEQPKFHPDRFTMVQSKKPAIIVRNYKTYQYGNYNRPFKSIQRERPINMYRSREKNLRSSIFRQKSTSRKSRLIRSPDRSQQWTSKLRKSSMAKWQDGARGRNWSIEQFI